MYRRLEVQRVLLKKGPFKSSRMGKSYRENGAFCIRRLNQTL